MLAATRQFQHVPSTGSDPVLRCAATAGGEHALMTEAFVQFDEEWDAGDLGCGELVLELRWRLARMQPDQVIRVIAVDPGARADMPAWCRLTGHTLVHQDHPVYLIRRQRPRGE